MKFNIFNKKKKESTVSSPENQNTDEEAHIPVLPGVARAEMLRHAWSKKSLIVAYVALFFAAFVFQFCGVTVKSYTPYATSSFRQHSMLTTAAVVYKIVCVITLPFVARIADCFSRVSGFFIALVFLIVTYIMFASSKNVGMYLASEIFLGIGKVSYVMMEKVFVADTTQILNRGLWTALPTAVASIPTLYISSIVAEKVLDHSTWRWGYGMWAIITPVSLAPLIFIMWRLDRKAQKYGVTHNIKASLNLPEGSWYKKLAHLLYVELDIVGGLLMLAGLSLFFLPFTLTGSASILDWDEATTIVLLVLGFVVLGVFVFWVLSKFPQRPFLSVSILKNPSVLLACALPLFDTINTSTSGAYYSSVLQVSGHFTVGEAARITRASRVCQLVGSVLVGILIKYTKTAKIFMISGISLIVITQGFFCYLSDHNGQFGSELHWTVIQVFEGFGRGFYNIPTIISVQANSDPSQIAPSIAMFTMFSQMGAVIGNSIAASVWNDLVIKRLTQYLPEGSESSATSIFGSIRVALGYKQGTPEREAIDRAYREVLQKQGYISLGFLLPALIIVFFIKGFDPTQRTSVEVDDNGEVVLKSATGKNGEAPQFHTISSNLSSSSSSSDLSEEKDSTSAASDEKKSLNTEAERK
ncbi:BA75_05247T0 [Komagataella pastoris]|uniref:BA75_05247T0 n=1 Tax=Komagataella pastoris TaxID=4922 RepID=A0A1B2JHY9_PICPA|nr:BA75_05247T0 [Komagataella pastoris]